LVCYTIVVVWISRFALGLCIANLLSMGENDE